MSASDCHTEPTAIEKANAPTSVRAQDGARSAAPHFSLLQTHLLPLLWLLTFKIHTSVFALTIVFNSAQSKAEMWICLKPTTLLYEKLTLHREKV